MESCSSNKKSFLIFEKNRNNETHHVSETEFKPQKIVKKIFGFSKKESVTLPDEILLFIFRLLFNHCAFRIKDFVNLRLVSQQYKRVSEDDSLWTSFLNPKVRCFSPDKTSLKILAENYERAISDVNVSQSQNVDTYLNKLKFFSHTDDAYGILEPKLLTKIILLWATYYPKEVILKMNEFSVRSEKYRFRICSKLANTFTTTNELTTLGDNIEKFDLSNVHKKRILSRIKFFKDEILKEKEEQRRWYKNEEKRAYDQLDRHREKVRILIEKQKEKEEKEWEKLYKDPVCIIF